MTSASPLALLARYTAWANEVLYTALAALPEPALEAPQKIVFGSILRTLHHVYAMDLVWQANLQGRAHGLTTRNPQRCPRFAQLRAAQAAVNDWYVHYADGLGAQAAAESVDFQFIGGGEGCMTRGEILLHVNNHATYHRGHIGTMIYEIPAEPPTTDLPVYLRNADRTP